MEMSSEQIVIECRDTNNLERKHIFEDSKTRAIHKLFKEYHYDQIKKNPNSVLRYIPKSEQDIFINYISKRTNTRYRYIMFTINFREDVTFQQAEKKFMKYAKKRWIKNTISCFEWREKNKGMHIHSRAELSSKKVPYECKREVYNTFKNLVGNKLHINVRYSNDENSFINYINGFKKNKPKEGSDNNKNMRRALNIPHPIILNNNKPIITI